MASPLDHDPKFPHYWSEHPRDKVFGANTNAFSSRFSEFSIPFAMKTPCSERQDKPSTLLLSAQRIQPHSCSSLPRIKIWPRIPVHHSAANTHTCVNSWAPSHQTNSSMWKCPFGTTYKYHLPNTPGNCRSLPYGTTKTGSASMLTTKTG